MLNEMTYWNASKFAIFLEYENPCSFFCLFFISCCFIFSPNEYPGLCRLKPGHSFGGKNEVAQNEKRKNLRGFSYSKNMASVSLGHFIKHKPLISEECHAMT